MHSDPEAGKGRFSCRQPPAHYSFVSYVKDPRKFRSAASTRPSGKLRRTVSEQFGFHLGHSTTYKLSERPTIGCFLDVEKAFRSVWPDGLLFKLREIQVPDCYIPLIASFLTERTFCVRIDNNVSSERRITTCLLYTSVSGKLQVVNR